MNGRYRGDEIAIIGMAGRFPGARDLEEFWRNLVGGVESISFLTREQLLAGGEDAEWIDKSNYVAACPILDDMEMFDAQFFGMTPREAEIKDPQQRVFLEAAYAALQHAGYDWTRIDASVGVFGGVFTNRYAWTNVRKNQPVVDAVGGIAIEIANHADYLATLVSYKLNLRGPSFTVATACSTSAVATHLACENLRSGACDMALAGGVEIELPHRLGYLYSEGGMLSRDGHCRPFDAKASGTIFGSGVGVVVLKRLNEAIRDRDHIHAVIRGTAINNDGSQKVGFTAPSVQGQAAVIAEAYGVSGVDPGTVTYVEAHGTATGLGDPIEVAALSQIFTANTDRRQWCAIGSVKSNIGHMGPAAGAASIIKATMALDREQIPPSINFEEPNPKIDFPGGPFYVASAPLPWPRAAEPRRAGVSSFGIGGTNAHIILEEAPPPEPSGPSRPYQLLGVSAKTATALEAASRELSDHLRAHDDLSLADVAYTLSVGREQMHFGRSAVCRDRDEAIRAFAGEDSKAFVAGQAEPHPRPIAFMFSGQGAQYPNMGLGLYREEPTFRMAVDRCAEILRPHLGRDIREILYPASDEDAAAALLGQTYITQPALFVIEYALAQLWMEWGARPQAMVGHSIGEYVAACLAGVFSLEDALALVAARGALMQSMPPGSMLAVPLGPEACREMLDGTLSLAAVNAPALCVVSGPAEEIDAFAARLAERGVQGTRLHTSHAFHSAMMDPIVERFAERVRAAAPQPPRIPFISDLTGMPITPEQAADPSYWARHLREAVLFADAVGELLKDQRQVLIEVGPGQTLMTFARQHPRAGTGRPILQSLRHPQKKDDDLAVMLTSLGRLWLTGYPVAWDAYWSRERRRRVVLPTYRFERKRHWVDPIKEPKAAKPKPGAAERLGIDEWSSIPVWRQSSGLQANGLAAALTAGQPWLIFADEHGIGAGLRAHIAELDGVPIVVTPGAGFAQDGERAFTIDPRSRADHVTLLQTLRGAGMKPRSIVHCWTVGTPEGISEIDAALRDEDLGFFGLSYLAQAIATVQQSDPVRLFVVSSEMQDVLGGEPIRPAKAVVLGPCLTLPKEQPNITCRSIDLRLSDLVTAKARVLGQLLAEIASDRDEEVVAYRGRRRWVRRYESSKLPVPEGPIARIRDGGVYLMTGGVGAVALTLAEHIARKGRARFVLVGRSTFLPREEWDGYVTQHPEGDRTTWQISKLRAIEALGAEVELVAADSTDPGQIRDVVRRTVERFGQLNGVLHAAGVAGGGMLAVKTREAAAKVLAPKVEGTLALEDAVRDVDLDWFVSCASLVAVSGDFGLGDYCSANSVLNAIADRAAARYPDRLTVSINWPAWLEVGMAVDASDVPQAFRELQKGSKSETVGHPLVDRRIFDNSGNTVFSTVLSPSATWVLDEHRINGHSLLPGVGYIEMARAAFNAANGDGVTELRDVLFLAPLKVEGNREVRAILRPGAERMSYSIVAAPQGTAMSTADWKEYSRGTIRQLAPEPAPVHDVAAIRARCGDVVTRGEEQRHSFVQVGRHWNNIRRVFVGQKEELAEIELPEELAEDIGRFVLHPSQLDSATSFAQTQIPAISYLPFGYSRIVVRAPLPRHFYSHIKYRESVSDFVTRDIVLMDPDGVELVNIEGFTLWKADPGAINASLDQDGTAAGGEEVLAATRDRRRTEMAFGILPEEAVQVFDRVLAAEAGPQVVICCEGLERKLERSKTVTQTRIAEELASTQLSAPVPTERNVANAYVAPETDLEKALAVLWQEALGVTQIGTEDDFFELGGNSLVAVQLASRVRDKFQVELALPTLFESPNVKRLAQSIEAALLEKVQGMSDAQVKAMLSTAR